MFLNLLADIDFGASFEESSKTMTFNIESTLLSILDHLKLKTVDEMGLFFKLLELDTKTICRKKLTEVGAWRCLDCVRNDSTIFCQECWSQMKDKHQNHNIVYINRVNGTCDCGDHNLINQKYFCPKHKGIFTSDAEIQNYIKASLGEALPPKIISANKPMFDHMAKYFLKAINDKRTQTKSFLKVVNEFVNCFGILCEMSTACNYIISDLLLKKYPMKVKHCCLDISENGVKIIKESFFAHDCTCPLIRYLLEFWPGKKEKLLYKLLSNYKLKKTIGLYYFLFYNEYFKNCIYDFEDLSVQIIFTDVLSLACTLPGLIDNIYEGMIEIFNIFVKEDAKIKFNDSESLLSQTLVFLNRNKRFNVMKEIVLKLRCDTIYLFKPVSYNYLANNTNIIFKLIDLTNILHNINSVKVILPPPTSKKGDKYLIEILDVEIWLLDTFALYVSIFNFNDIDLVKEVFVYFSKVIQKRSKNELEADEYTFHITLYRAFSIFLNRYCFHEANKNNSNILATLQNVVKLMPDFIKLSKKMVKSIYKVFGFITACQEEFFSYYGENMIQYEYLYYYNRQFIYRDFCLLKYLLSIKENAKYLGFKEILRLCQVENSNKPIEDYILKGDKVVEPDLWLNAWNKQYLKFSSKILFIILSLLRNNTCMIWNLSSAYSMMKSNRIKDKLIDDILKKDINNFLELTKELVINQILIKENLAYFSEINDNIFLCLKDFFGEKNVTDIIISLTNKTLTKEKKAKFSLKDELLYYYDLNYIIYPIHKSKAEKYISDFKSKLVSIFNIHFYPVNKFESKLTEENYNQLYFNDKNFDFLFQFTSFILTQKGYEILNEYFLSVLLNYLSTFLCVESDHFTFLRENLKTNDIIKVLENNNLVDEVKKSYCKFIVEKFREQKIPELNPFDLNNKNSNKNKNELKDKNEIKDICEKPDKDTGMAKNENNVQPVKKSGKISMKEKMKNKFKKKNVNLIDKLGVDKIVIDEVKKDSESCIFCLKPIESDDIKKPYGLIGDFMFDNYTSNAFFQAIRKEYKQYYDKDLNLPEFDKLYYQPLERRTIKIISCNHKIHFPCYFKQFMESNLKKSLSIYSCPLCNRLSETYIPMLYQYTDEQVCGFLKGYDYNYVFNYGKKHIAAYEKKIAEELNKKKNEEKKEEKKEEENEEKEEDEEKEKEKDDEYNEFEDFFFGKENEDKDETKNEDDKEDNEETIKIDEEQLNKINLFKSTYSDFYNSCKHFVEGFVGMRFIVGSVDLDEELVKTIMEKFSTAISIQYRDLMCYLDNLEEKNFTMNLWKNFMLSMRLMLKLNVINSDTYICRLFKMIKEFKTQKFEKHIEEIVQNDNAKLKTCELLSLFALLFEYEQIEGYEKYIIYMVLPIYVFGFFFKSIYFKTSFEFSPKIFEEHLGKDELCEFLYNEPTLNRIMPQITKQLVYNKVAMRKDIDLDKINIELNDNLDFLNLPSLKNKNIFETFEELDKLIEEDAKDEKKKHLYNNLKLPYNYNEIFDFLLSEHMVAIQSEICDKVLSPALFGSCLPTKFHFIDLPELAIDFEYESYNKICQVCGLKGKVSLICLDCGRKVCDSRSCLTKFNGESMAGFMAHCKICGGGRTAYLQTDDCSVLFISNKAVFRKFIPLYVNEFGEGISKSTFGKEFKLNKDEVQKALKMFTEYSYSNAEIIT